MAKVKAESWEIPITFEQAQWFWRGRQQQFFEESCAFPVGKWLNRQCFHNPGYGPENLYCTQHSRMFEKKSGVWKLI